MGEEKEKIKIEKKKNEAGKKSAGGGKNADDGSGGIGTILLKLDLHCDGCAMKVRRCVRHFEGVEDVKADASTGKLTVKGNVDPLWLREKVESKIKKKVALLSAQPKKVSGGAGGEKKSDEKVEHKAAEEKKNSDEKAENRVSEEKKGEHKKPKKVQCNREVVQLHCDGSAKKVKRFIVKQLTPYLKHKLKRDVAVVPPKKGAGSGVRGDNKKKKEVARGGGDGKKKDGSSSSTMASKSTEPKEQKAEAMNSKMEYYSAGGCYNNPNMNYTMPPAMYNQNYSNGDYGDYGVTMQDHHGYYGHSNGYMQPPPYLTASRDYGYGHSTGYVSPRHFTTPRDRDHGHGHTGYVPQPYIAPQYFSDENPNACSVM